MRSMLIRIVAMAAAAISLGCQPAGNELVPQSVMVVYDEVAAGRVIGSSEQALPVLGFIYPDKTTYVLKVCYHGRVGFVRDGIAAVRPAGPRSNECR